MLNDYRALAIFLAVSDTGSFSAAGRRLNLSTSVVSHHVAKLEARLGATLFFRSSRRLSLSSEGRAILDAARRMVAAGDEAFDSLSECSTQPIGTLRLTVPAFGEHMHLRRSIWEFARLHPSVSISLSSSDEPADLIKDGFDLAIRLGELADSRLKTRRIGSFERALVASPHYLSEHGTPSHPNQLAQHQFVSIAIVSNTFTLTGEDRQVEVRPVKIRLEVDTIATAKSAVVAGFGIQRLPVEEVAQELRSGDLVEVLPGWSVTILGMYALWPDSGPQKHLTRRFIDHLVNGRSDNSEGLPRR